MYLIVTHRWNRPKKECFSLVYSENLKFIEKCNYMTYDFTKEAEVILIGGEPMLDRNFTYHIAKHIKQVSPLTKVKLVTSWTGTWLDNDVLKIIDGIEFIVQNQFDVVELERLDCILCKMNKIELSVIQHAKVTIPKLLLDWKVVSSSRIHKRSMKNVFKLHNVVDTIEYDMI